jgi:hypothetical protein
MGEYGGFGVACAKSVPFSPSMLPGLAQGESRSRSGRPSGARGSKWI